jgi:hypothetical protein
MYHIQQTPFILGDSISAILSSFFCPGGTTDTSATMALQIRGMQSLVGVLHWICWVYHPGGTMICTDTLLGTTTRISSKLQAISYAKSSRTTVPALAHRLNALGRSS